MSCQILTSFPNQNEKNIDYIIVYEKLGFLVNGDTINQRKQIVRQAFFNKLFFISFNLFQILSNIKLYTSYKLALLL